MKLVLAIISNNDANNVVPQLLKDGYAVTTLSSTGGFFSAGNTTLLVVTEDDKIEQLRGDLEKYTSKRQNVDVSKTPAKGKAQGTVNVGGATLFVLNVDRFEKY